MLYKRISCLILACLMLCTPLFSVSAAAAKGSTPKIVGVQVQVKADFTAKFYIEASPNATEVGVYRGGKKIVGEKIEDGRWIVSVSHISPSKMTELIEVEPYAIVGTMSRGNAYHFSLQGYATRLLADNSLTEETRAMLIAMLNFGAACQINSGGDVDDLPNASLTDEEKNVPTREYGSVFAKLGGDEESYVSLALSVQVSTALALELLVRSGITGTAGVYMEIDDDATFSDPVRYEVKAVDGLFTVRTGAMYINSLSKTYYVRLVTPKGTSCPFSYSVESYAHETFASEDQLGMSTEKQLFIKAMMAFGDALIAYEESLT